MTTKVLVIGAALVDLMTNVDHLPHAGEDISADTPKITVGGCALNVCSALQKNNIAVDLLIPVGQGPYAQIIQKQFIQHNIHSLITPQKSDNGWDLCLVEANGERSFVTFAGVEQSWQEDWFVNCDWSNYQYIYLSGYELENKTSAQIILRQLRQNASQIPILFDASPRIGALDPTILRELWQLSVIVHANQAELAILATQATSLKQQLFHVKQLTQMPVIATLGAHGTIYLLDNECILVPGEAAVKIQNTSGAGDAHCGGLLVAKMQNKTWPRAIQFANELAALVVQKAASNFY
ncbi:PfkB family carbohydrate kinase [Bombilactobacillus thymidiniphilus]|uniref:PfkB family carbohydrate kinase n=1 Tax=Bombilactobacillus thymidiniphilus TaxID=2923363 RepID=A0ABY4PEW5_9LACO|nr:PfkB family carbohydrate kinase [Bombilactobacillus thymidiniphilus]UQS84239.1 PfkB family carbohydrate kinase [Bombilactobacillus thymidiniphilus]